MSKKLFFYCITILVSIPGFSFAVGKPDPPKIKVSKLHSDNPKVESRLIDLIDNLKNRRTTKVNAQVKLENIYMVGNKIKVEAMLFNGKPDFSELATLGVEKDDLYYEMKDRIQMLVPYNRIQELAKLPNIGFVQIPLAPEPTVIISEGVGTMNAGYYHNAGYKGQGVKVAIIDGGFQGYSDLLGTELPSSVTVKSFYNSITGNGDITGGGEVHGTACAEIVHDVAPEAELYLINYYSVAELDAAVQWAISQGVQVISHSVGWFNQSFYDGSGPVSEIANRRELPG